MESFDVTDDETTDAVAAWKFFRALKISRLLPCAEVDALERRGAEEPLSSILGELLRKKRLTEYQIARIRGGTPQGLVLGKYHILREIGQGGFGQVYQAYHTLMNRVVALKKLTHHPDLDEIDRAIFLREVAACTRLAHPNIASAYDADECDGELYFVMEYVDGSTLEGFVARHGPVPVPLAQEILLQTARALDHAHQLGTVHRDVKPANVMFTGGGQTDSGTAIPLTVKLLDFGLARFRYTENPAVDTLPCRLGGLLGTPAYVAPEQIRDPHSADTRSDLYSLGCTLFYALAGRMPFGGTTVAATIAMHLSEAPMSVRLLRPSVPDELAALVLRLMAKDPDARFQTPGELIDAVSALSSPSRLGALPAKREVLEFATADRIDTEDDCPPAGVTQVIDSVLVPLVMPAPLDPAPPDPAPPDPASPDRLDALHPLWAEWLEVVERLASGEPAGMTAEEYKGLYRELRAVAAAARKAGTPPGSPTERVWTTVEPWVTQSALEHLDHKMLSGLWGTCRSIDALTFPESRGRRSPPRVAAVVLIGVAVAAFLLVAVLGKISLPAL